MLDQDRTSVTSNLHAAHELAKVVPICGDCHRRLTTGHCVVCGDCIQREITAETIDGDVVTTLVSRRTDAKFCSSACRQKAYRRRVRTMGLAVTLGGPSDGS